MLLFFFPTPGWGNASSLVLPSPTRGYRHMWCLPLWVCRRVLPCLTAPGLQCDLWRVGGCWACLSSTSAPGRLQLPGLPNSGGLDLESSLRLFVERESAKCHSDFCPLVSQALPATGAERLWAEPHWIAGVGGKGLIGVQEVCEWALTLPKPFEGPHLIE